MKQRGWKVKLAGKVIDVVFFDKDITDRVQVKKSLVEHDGYDPKIEVIKTKTRQKEKKSASVDS